jgi:glyoxylase-like metal-dependent hydrolase (beta-lactamase superfamily II)
VAEEVELHSARPAALLATHGHHDHIAAAATLSERWKVPFFLHPADAPLLRRMNFYRKLFDGAGRARVLERWTPLVPSEELGFGDLRVEVIETPGHTPGGVTFRIGDWLFPGDLLLPAGAGRTDLPGGDRTALQGSLAAIGLLPPHLKVHPGHGDSFPLGEGLKVARRRLS